MTDVSSANYAYFYRLDKSMRGKNLFLAPGKLQLWYAFPDEINQPELLQQYEQMLSADEHDSYQRLQQHEHKREYLVSHALLRSCLSQYVDKQPSDWDFLYNDHGKPSVLIEDEGLDIQFNIAHTSGLVVCAISASAEVGVDVEFHSDSQALLEMADHYFSEKEIIALNRLSKTDQEISFFRYWTLKEAYIKAVGEGLLTPSADFSFEFDTTGGISFTPANSDALDVGSEWSFHVIDPVEDYTVGLAVHSAASTVSLFEAIPQHSFQPKN